MSDFVETVREIQRAAGLTGSAVDGIFGPVTAAAVLRKMSGEKPAKAGAPIGAPIGAALDARTVENIATLDPQARRRFDQFACLAAATAATLGCDYVGISGNRSYEEQNALYEIGRSKPGDVVTNARAGFSNHNFGIAMDFGVFRGGAYLDTDEPATAAKVHKACSEHAGGCGLEWGGTWNGFKDLPHFEVKTGLTMAEKRKRMKEKGTVLS